MAANRKLGRTTEHRMAMLRAMVTFLLENGRIETTLARAKEVAPLCEKMITLGKKNTLATRRQLWLSLPRKLLLQSCSLRLLRSTLSVTVVTPASSRPVPAVVTALRWQSSSWYKFKVSGVNAFL